MIKFSQMAIRSAALYFLNSGKPENIWLRLFSSDKNGTASNRSEIIEVFGGGYSPIEIPGASWSSLTPDSPEFKAPPQSFKFTGDAGEVIGYFMTRGPGGELVGHERFPSGPVRVENNGDTITIIPSITFG